MTQFVNTMAYLKYNQRERKTMFMTFEKDAALKAGGGDFVTETGCYVGAITAKAITARSGALGVEFSMKTDEGLTANYINIYFQKSDGTQIKGGYNLLQGLMGIFKLSNLNQPTPDANGDYYITEFHGKRACFALQKRVYTKNDGSDGFDFQLRAVGDADTLKTFKELATGSEAKKIPGLDESMKDIDERSEAQQSAPTSNHQSAPADNEFDDFF